VGLGPARVADFRGVHSFRCTGQLNERAAHPSDCGRSTRAPGNPQGGRPFDTGGRSIQIAENSVGTPVAVSDRQVQIRFLATTNSALPWAFKPADKTATVQLGALSEARYLATNLTETTIVGQATYNVSPPEASLYFVKTECFCFTKQLLTARETREMPVYYFVQPDLPDHIREITLSYTFYRNDDATGADLALASAVSQE
jgi:cytochrome c oxidase assembly protein Cox11